ncbi:MAG: hypothetical protein QW356_05120 [Candidatus Hadarchaeales archaeon]
MTGPTPPSGVANSIAAFLIFITIGISIVAITQALSARYAYYRYEAEKRATLLFSLAQLPVPIAIVLFSYSLYALTKGRGIAEKSPGWLPYLPISFSIIALTALGGLIGTYPWHGSRGDLGGASALLYASLLIFITILVTKALHKLVREKIDIKIPQIWAHYTAFTLMGVALMFIIFAAASDIPELAALTGIAFLVAIGFDMLYQYYYKRAITDSGKWTPPLWTLLPIYLVLMIINCCIWFGIASNSDDLLIVGLSSIEWVIPSIILRNCLVVEAWRKQLS